MEFNMIYVTIYIKWRYVKTCYNLFYNCSEKKQKTTRHIPKLSTFQAKIATII